MAKKKRHHYIPRFYLSRFSVNNEGKFIGLYNHKKNVFVQEAPLRHQAYRNSLYGEDNEIEDALAEMEDKIARLFNYWTEEKQLYLPPVETNGFKLLKRFIFYQAFRVPKSGSDITEAVNQGLKTVIKEMEPDFWEKIKDKTLVHDNPVLLGFLSAIEHEHLLDFLDCKFLVNLSTLPFITSDAPVVLYNQLMENAQNYIGATGLAAKGLQVFYPIHPRLMICLYDPNVYNLGNTDTTCCSTESAEEVDQLNGLQFANCESQLFFDDLISEDYILELCNHYKDHKASSQKINHILHQDSRKFFFTSSEDAQIGLKLSFFKLKINPNDYKASIAPVRHPSFIRPTI